jgi:UDP-2,3-diacylglucosamine pyrophosphatase LpxH
LYILATGGIIIPLAVLIYITGVSAVGKADIPPQVYIADGTGRHGIPDLAVVCYTAEPAATSLTWGTAGISDRVSDSSPVRQHVYMLRDLTPDTEYWYRIGDSGETYRFRTPGIDGLPLRFAVGSDAHFGSEHSRNDLTGTILAHISDPANVFSYQFLLGDMVEYGFINDQWHEALRAVSASAVTIPARLVPGNHDTLFTGDDLYDYYGYPAGMDLQTGSRRWSRIDVGDVHFLLLDLEWNLETYTDEQAGWLAAQLECIPDDEWKIVMSHGYYYASGSSMDGWPWYDNPDTITALTPLFEENGVDIVFSGHIHQMELLEQSNVTYVICSGLGGLPDPERAYLSPASQWYVSGEYGYTDVTIDGEGARIFFRDPENAEIKRFTVARN